MKHSPCAKLKVKVKVKNVSCEAKGSMVKKEAKVRPEDRAVTTVAEFVFVLPE